MNNIQTIFFLSLAGKWHGLCRLLFSLCSRTPCCETTDIRNMEFDNIANEKIRRNSTNTWRASSRRDTTKVSSCLASPDAPISDGWRRWVARGLHFGGSLLRGRWGSGPGGAGWGDGAGWGPGWQGTLHGFRQNATTN